MKGLETGKDKVKKICDVLRKETLEPAKHEVEEMKEAARRQADETLADAKDTAEKMLEDARKEIERQKTIFQASLSAACRQTLDLLKEKIRDKLFNPALSELIAKPLKDPKVIAQIITAVVKAVDKDGLEADLSVYIPAAVPAEEVNKLLASSVIERLKEKGVLLSPIGGGIEMKLVQNNVTIDVSDEALKEIVAGYIRKDFREMVFGTT